MSVAAHSRPLSVVVAGGHNQHVGPPLSVLRIEGPGMDGAQVVVGTEVSGRHHQQHVVLQGVGDGLLHLFGMGGVVFAEAHVHYLGTLVHGIVEGCLHVPVVFVTVGDGPDGYQLAHSIGHAHHVGYQAAYHGAMVGSAFGVGVAVVEVGEVEEVVPQLVVGVIVGIQAGHPLAAQFVVVPEALHDAVPWGLLPVAQAMGERRFQRGGYACGVLDVNLEQLLQGGGLTRIGLLHQGVDKRDCLPRVGLVHGHEQVRLDVYLPGHLLVMGVFGRVGHGGGIGRVLVFGIETLEFAESFCTSAVERLAAGVAQEVPAQGVGKRSLDKGVVTPESAVDDGRAHSSGWLQLVAADEELHGVCVDAACGIAVRVPPCVRHVLGLQVADCQQQENECHLADGK